MNGQPELIPATIADAIIEKGPVVTESGQPDLIPATIAGAFAFGMVLALLGSIKLPLAKRLEIDEARVGGLLSALNLALIPMMLLSGMLVDRLGIQGVLIVGSVLAGLAIFALALVKTYAGSVY